MQHDLTSGRQMMHSGVNFRREMASTIRAPPIVMTGPAGCHLRAIGDRQVAGTADFALVRTCCAI